jgi:nucleoside-triphosphatase THEP1
VILDEVGPMELEGSGWDRILKFLEKQQDIIQLWIVREQILQKVLERWSIPYSHLLGTTDEEEDDLLNRIDAKLKKIVTG